MRRNARLCFRSAADRAFGETVILLCVIGPATTSSDAIVVPGTSKPTPPPRTFFFLFFVRVLPPESLIIPRDDRVLSKTRNHRMGNLVCSGISCFLWFRLQYTRPDNHWSFICEFSSLVNRFIDADFDGGTTKQPNRLIHFKVYTF